MMMMMIAGRFIVWEAHVRQNSEVVITFLPYKRRGTREVLVNLCRTHYFTRLTVLVDMDILEFTV